MLGIFVSTGPYIDHLLFVLSSFFGFATFSDIHYWTVSLDYIALRVVQTISAPYPVLQTFLTPMSIKFSPLWANFQDTKSICCWRNSPLYVESITVIFSSLFVSAVLEYQIAWKLGKNIHSLLQSSLSLGLRLVCVCVCVCVCLWTSFKRTQSSQLWVAHQWCQNLSNRLSKEIWNIFCLNRWWGTWLGSTWSVSPLFLTLWEEGELEGPRILWQNNGLVVFTCFYFQFTWSFQRCWRLILNWKGNFWKAKYSLFGISSVP